MLVLKSVGTASLSSGFGSEWEWCVRVIQHQYTRSYRWKWLGWMPHLGQGHRTCRSQIRPLEPSSSPVSSEHDDAWIFPAEGSSWSIRRSLLPCHSRCGPRTNPFEPFRSLPTRTSTIYLTWHDKFKWRIGEDVSYRFEDLIGSSAIPHSRQTHSSCCTEKNGREFMTMGWNPRDCLAQTRLKVFGQWSEILLEIGDRLQFDRLIRLVRIRTVDGKQRTNEQFVHRWGRS